MCGNGVGISSRGQQLLRNTELLNAAPSPAEQRLTYWLAGLLMLGFLLSLAVSQQQWPSSNLLPLMAVAVAFAEVATGGLLLVQALIMRRDAVLVLASGYLVGGLVIFVNLMLVDDLATRLWCFRLWHGVFVLGILGYAIVRRMPTGQLSRSRFSRRFQSWLLVGAAFLTMLILYLLYRPFDLPTIVYEGGDFRTAANVLVNGVQLVLVLLAWGLLVMDRRRTVMSVWMTVVAMAVAIDIVLFIVGGRMFSAGLYLSKMNNMLAGTLMFGVILYHYVRIQRELMRSRIHLLRANRRLNRMALTDPLTGLPNRACLYPFLDHALGRARRDQEQLAVCVIDLDDFKPVNDRYGHQVGDELLRALARRLSGILRGGEFLVRQGGDEFVLVLEGLPNEEALKPVMERIVHALATPFALGDDIHVNIHASIGVALYPMATTPEALLRIADAALYRSKNNKFDRDQNWALHTAEPLAD